MVRLQGNDDKLLLNGFGKSQVDLFDYGVNCQEAKCGTSFLREKCFSGLARLPDELLSHYLHGRW